MSLETVLILLCSAWWVFAVPKLKDHHGLLMRVSVGSLAFALTLAVLAMGVALGRVGELIFWGFLITGGLLIVRVLLGELKRPQLLVRLLN